ncbi:DUF6712 family protein [Spirosoma sp.]|uniref:DUF6712 family protein n=1 Tax=Spirosoma sp. TaxID=1899569 RepID=UPI00262A5BF4|nr:DUF6712 family protein [Spirosoma sp.]MCX6216575.1 hypothetical protein [Spirosoma sp.]
MSNLVTVETLKLHLGGIQTKLNFETVEPFVKTSIRWFRRMVGSDMMDYLEDLLEAGSNAERDLLELAQSCICWYAYDLAFPHLKIRVGDLGLTKANPNQTTPITKWEYIDSKDANLQMLDLSLEDFFSLLEELRPQAWVSSEAYQKRQERFIRSAGELARWVPTMGKQSRMFDQLITYIERAEELYIRPALTDSVFDELKEKCKGLRLGLTIQESKLLNELLPAVAHLAIFEALPYLSLNVSPVGISEQRSKSGLLEQVAPGAGVRDSLRQQFLNDASVYLGRATKYLDSAATPELFSGYYQANKGQTAEAIDFTNSTSIIL